MKESRFIKKNLESWKDYEQVITQKHKMPRKLSKLFVKITDDLSYSYTYYNNRSVRLYLNGVAKKLFNQVHKSEQFRLSRVRKFFTHSVPLAIYDARKEFIITFILFSLSMLIGAFSSKHDPEFARIILGDNYVNITQENIENNDPMAIYKDMAPFDMFFAITLNNCRVALLTFVMGFFMAIGTIVIMIHNGVMVGTFQYFFVEYGMFKESFLTIWQHGVFEISSIIMSGAAGLVLGKGLVFPGNYTRFQSLRISARKGLKLMMGIIPILIVAGFIEGFYTRYTEAPQALRIATILASTLFIIGYFVVLPRKRGRNQSMKRNEIEYLEATSDGKVSFDRILTASETFMISFQQLKNNLGKFIRATLLLGLLYPLINIILDLSLNEYAQDEHYYFGPVEYTVEQIKGISILWILFALTSIFLTRIRLNRNSSNEFYKLGITRILQIILLQCIVHLPLLIPSKFFAIVIYLALLIYSLYLLAVATSEHSGLLGAFKLSLRYLSGSFNKFLSITIRYFIISILFYFVFMRFIAAMNDELIRMNIYGETVNGYQVLYYVNMFYFAFMMLFSYSVFYIGYKTLFVSLYETINASNLKSRIQNIGSIKRIRGLVRE